MVSRQLESCAKAMGTPGPDSANIQPGMPLQTRKHILVNNIPANNPHMTTLLPVFKNVWAYMLGMK
jgi:hypothetical protein